MGGRPLGGGVVANEPFADAEALDDPAVAGCSGTLGPPPHATTRPTSATAPVAVALTR